MRAGMRANRPQDAGAPYGARPARRMRALHSYGDGVAGEFTRGCKVTLVITILSDGRGVPSTVGALMMTSAFLIPSTTFPKTVYCLSNAGCFFSVMNHWQFAPLTSLVRAAPSV